MKRSGDVVSLVERPDVARIVWPHGSVAHCLYPAWEAHDFSSVSEPGSIGVAFTGQVAAVVQREGTSKGERWDIPADSIVLCGGEPLHWLRAPSPSDLVEVTAPASLRSEIAESMGVACHAHLGDIHGRFDAVVLSIASQLRAAARGWSSLSDLASDDLVRSLYAHVYRTQFGGRWPIGRVRALSASQIAKITEVVHERLAGELSIAALAEAVSLSPFHFARSFKLATGIAPHRFVSIIRLQQAHRLLMCTRMSVSNVAATVGYSNVSHFRRKFRDQFGALPSTR